MHLLFLPGAGGAPEFWHALGALLPAQWTKTYLAWPGLGEQPHDQAVHGFDGLVALAERVIDGPVAVVAQSMGGIVAVRLALQFPQHVTHLVLAATSGGLDVAELGGEDWRTGYQRSFPNAQTWITTERPDHSAEMENIACPTLLLWGERDAISPVAVGQRLATLIPDAELHVIPEAAHDLGHSRASDIAAIVLQHLRRPVRVQDRT